MKCEWIVGVVLLICLSFSFSNAANWRRTTSYIEGVLQFQRDPTESKNDIGVSVAKLGMIGTNLALGVGAGESSDVQLAPQNSGIILIYQLQNLSNILIGDNGAFADPPYQIFGFSQIPELLTQDYFGASMVFLGYTAATEWAVAVGAPGDNNGTPVTGSDRIRKGAIYVVYFSAVNGAYLRHHKLVVSSFLPAFGNNEAFGFSLSAADINGDGTLDLWVGAPGRGDTNSISGTTSVIKGAGAVYGVLLDNTQVAIGAFRLNVEAAGLVPTNTPSSGWNFGYSVLYAGNYYGDGSVTLFIGAPFKSPQGSVYAVYLAPDHTVLGFQEFPANVPLSAYQGPTSQPVSGTYFDNGNPINLSALFGSALALSPSLEGLTYPDLLVGAPKQKVAEFSTSSTTGDVYVLNIVKNPASTGYSNNFLVDSTYSLFADMFNKTSIDTDNFGRSIANIGDLDNNGGPELLVGANLDLSQGTTYLILLGGPPPTQTASATSSATPSSSVSITSTPSISVSLTPSSSVSISSTPSLSITATPSASVSPSLTSTPSTSTSPSTSMSASPSPSPNYCGDGLCNYAEDCDNCPIDCPSRRLFYPQTGSTTLVPHSLNFCCSAELGSCPRTEGVGCGCGAGRSTGDLNTQTGEDIICVTPFSYDLSCNRIPRVIEG